MSALSETKVLDLTAAECMVEAGLPGKMTISTDGAEWIVEANEAGRYRFVIRQSPDDGPVRQFGLVLLGLTGWSIEPVYCSEVLGGGRPPFTEIRRLRLPGPPR